ncbi:hypothetical protein BC939DRAFT_233013 [Gamsiella multidivaricata]|uniref:uncharacterized protein n=1 Tax=Gamsiella multidivaricata TaxID=101098 RepID=UPI00221ED161|nr:uncharacterized protein BC939DRAFT_233013 [Gamsiella multidivaricata]KAI7820382.1 hypothetical protein BC939DRAFT_233013 [Gamsiella multidivaricata]
MLHALYSVQTSWEHKKDTDIRKGEPIPLPLSHTHFLILSFSSTTSATSIKRLHRQLLLSHTFFHSYTLRTIDSNHCNAKQPAKPKKTPHSSFLSIQPNSPHCFSPKPFERTHLFLKLHPLLYSVALFLSFSPSLHRSLLRVPPTPLSLTPFIPNSRLGHIQSIRLHFICTH